MTTQDRAASARPRLRDDPGPLVVLALLGALGAALLVLLAVLLVAG